MHSVHANVQKHQNKISVFHWHTCMYTTIICLGKRVIKTNPSKFDERLSQKYVCEITFETRITRLQEILDFIFWGREFQRDAPAKDMLVLNKSSLGLGTRRFVERAEFYFYVRGLRFINISLSWLLLWLWWLLLLNISLFHLKEKWVPHMDNSNNIKQSTCIQD